jgi:hypothetical protein
LKFGNVLCLVACIGASGCSTDEPVARYLQRRAGITICPAVKVAEPSEAHDTRDVSHFTFHVDGGCKATFLRSVYASSGGECEAMLPKHGACMYEFKNGPSVIVRKLGSDSDFEITTY